MDIRKSFKNTAGVSVVSLNYHQGLLELCTLDSLTNKTNRYHFNYKDMIEFRDTLNKVISDQIDSGWVKGES